MELLKFLNEHKSDWEEKLSSEPFYLSISKDDKFVLFKYNAYASDMGNEIVQEARGSIFTFDKDEDEWKCVCYPFKKFFNAAEPYAATHLIDWNSARVMQKVDGSLIKFWYYDNEWHISTNGTINAANAEAIDGYNYEQLVMNALGSYVDFTDYLNPHYCYMFELTSPYNRIVVKYNGTHLWYLGRRNMTTFEEDASDPYIPIYAKFPKLYRLNSLSDCLAAAKEMDLSEEGYVVVDKNFNRIKIKGEAYLEAHKMRQNGAVSVKNIIELWKNDQIDDFLSIYPEYMEFVEDIMSEIRELVDVSDAAYNSVANITVRKEFASYANGYPALIKSYMFARLDGKCESAIQFYKDARIPSLLSYIAPRVKEQTSGVVEDDA